VQAVVRQLLECRLSLEKEVGLPDEKRPVSRHSLITVVDNKNCVEDWADKEISFCPPVGRR
jgi:hypothetical protein